MASSGKYVKVLRTMRAVLVREMPDVSVLLSTAELGPHFTSYEKNEATSPQRASERAEKLLQIMTYKSYEVYQKFVCVVRQFRPELAVKLEGAERQTSVSSTASSPESNGSPPVFPGGRDVVAPMEVAGEDDDAGLYGTEGCGSGTNHLVSHLSLDATLFLSKTLNGTPPERKVFHSFCHALGAGNRLVQASARSRNPTAYLLQEMPNCTFDRLEQALSDIGKRELFEQLWQKMDHGNF